MKKKGAVLLRTLLVGFVIAALLGIGLSETMNGFTSKYGVTVDDNVTDALSAFNESALNDMYVWSKGFQNQTQVEQGVSETTGDAIFTSSSFQIVKKSFDLLDQVWDMVNRQAKMIGIPEWALEGLSIIILIVITLVVMSALFRKDT